MAAQPRPLTNDRLKRALEMHVTATGQTISEGEQDGQKRFLLDPGSITCSIKDGRLLCSSQGVYDALVEILMFMDDEPARAPQNEDNKAGGVIVSPKPRNARDGALVSSTRTGSQRTSLIPRDVQVSELTVEDITSYLCPKASPEEAFMFLKLCQARNLNPFLKEAYLIKYDSSKPATMVTGKDAFVRKAEEHPQFDGFKAGIILEDAQGNLQEREGTFLRDGEKLLGGWAEVHRRDRKMPFKVTLSLKEYDKKQANWATMPCTMIRKYALVAALRECFPADLGGMYDSSEVIDVDGEVVA